MRTHYISGLQEKNAKPSTANLGAMMRCRCVFDHSVLLTQKF